MFAVTPSVEVLLAHFSVPIGFVDVYFSPRVRQSLAGSPRRSEPILAIARER